MNSSQLENITEAVHIRNKNIKVPRSKYDKNYDIFMEKIIKNFFELC